MIPKDWFGEATTWSRRSIVAAISILRPLGTGSSHRFDESADRSGGHIRPEHLAPAATVSTTAVACVPTANVAALAALVVRLAIVQACRTRRRPAKIAVVPNFRTTWLEYQDRAPRNVVSPHAIDKTQPQSDSKSGRFQGECNVPTAIAPSLRPEIRRNRPVSRLLIAPAQRSK